MMTYPHGDGNAIRSRVLSIVRIIYATKFDFVNIPSFD